MWIPIAWHLAHYRLPLDTLLGQPNLFFLRYLWFNFYSRVIRQCHRLCLKEDLAESVDLSLPFFVSIVYLCLFCIQVLDLVIQPSTLLEQLVVLLFVLVNLLALLLDFNFVIAEFVNK